MSVLYRNVEEYDYPEIEQLINSTWKFDEIISDKQTLHIALSLYLNAVLQASTYGQVAVYEGKVIGVIFGSAKQCVKKHTSLEKHAMDLFDHIENEAHSTFFIAYKEVILETYKELLEKTNQEFDGAVEFFAVSSEYRGLHVGSHLMNYLFDYFNEQKVNSIYVYTDTTCNYGYYDHRGFVLRGEKSVVFNLEPAKIPMNIFIYSYDFEKKKR